MEASTGEQEDTGNNTTAAATASAAIDSTAHSVQPPAVDLQDAGRNSLQDSTGALQGFVAMLPSECSFAESVDDDAAAPPTPHVPVLLSAFEGEGLQVVSAKASRAAADSWEPQADEFEYSLDAHHHHAGSTSHFAHPAALQRSEQDELALPSAFSSLLSRRTLSAVMEVDNEGLEEDTKGGWAQEQQQQQQQLRLEPGHSSSSSSKPERQQVQQVQTSVATQQQSRPQQMQQQEQGACLDSGEQQLQQPDPPQSVPPQQEQSLEPQVQLQQQEAQQQQAPPDDSMQLNAFLTGAVAAADIALDICGADATNSRTDHTEQQQQPPPDKCQGGQQQQQQHDRRQGGPKQQQQQPQQQQAETQRASGRHKRPDQHVMQQQQPDIGSHALSATMQEMPAEAVAAVAGHNAADGAPLDGSLDGMHHAAVQVHVASQAAHGLESVDAASKAAGRKAGCKPGPQAAAATAAAGAAAGAGDGTLADEWDAANKQRLQEMQQKQANSPAAPGVMSYEAAEAALLATDVKAHRAAVLQSLQSAKPSRLSQGLQLLLGGCCRHAGSRLREGTVQHEQAVLLLSLARTPMSDAEPAHLQMLQSVYSNLTGAAEPAPRFGSHWSKVGFQGDDPATDLRGAGMLGLLQLLYLTHHDASAAKKLYQLSTGTKQEFPLAVVSLNITRWTLAAVRSGALSTPARKLAGYLPAANHFYCGAFYEFYTRWCQGKTMRQAGFMLKQLEDHCKRHPAKLLQLAAAPDRAVAAADAKAWQPC